MEQMVNDPKHYDIVLVELRCVDINRHLPGSLAAAFKYIWRAGKKGDKQKGLEDLDKAIWYLNDWITNSSYCSKVFPEANAVFGLYNRAYFSGIINPIGDRFDALRAIVRGNIGEAINAVKNLRMQFEEEE